MSTEIEEVAQKLLTRAWSLVTAESCTGGLLSVALTDVPGCSHWFERGYIVYSNESKVELLDVPEVVIEAYSAVSEQAVLAMAVGALKYSHAQVSMAISGMAGPHTDSADHPVGQVWFGTASMEWEPQAKVIQFEGDRFAIRQQTVLFALKWLSVLLSS